MRGDELKLLAEGDRWTRFDEQGPESVRVVECILTSTDKGFLPSLNWVTVTIELS